MDGQGREEGANQPPKSFFSCVARNIAFVQVPYRSTQKGNTGMKNQKSNPVLVVFVFALALVFTLSAYGYSEMALGLKVKDWLDVSVNAKK